jgi:lipoprotein-anchoring transpeptidase ErfK/SrfK
MRHFTMAAVAVALLVARPAAALANVVITIDKSAQRMSVSVDGSERYSWPVSTGLLGGPPAGSYRPERMERSWFSRKFGMSPMPHAIFFHEGYAIHGTIYVSRLGHRASHGCVRLLPANAATLFSLVEQQGLDHTEIMIDR